MPRDAAPIRKPATSSWWCRPPRRYSLSLRSSGESFPAYVGKHPRKRAVASAAHRSEEDTPRDSAVDNSYQSYDSESSRTVVGQAMSEDAEDGSDVVYPLKAHETAETCDLDVYGEVSPGDDSDSTDSSGIPIRALSDFAIYDLHDRHLVSFDTLCSEGGLSVGIGASGVVAAWIDDGEDYGVVENEDFELLVALTEILEVSVNHVNEEAGDRDLLDDKIYIRTQHAWYILDIPSEVYTPFFTGFWTKHHLFQLLVTSSIENPRLNFSDFEETLASLIDQEAEKLLGRQITLSDFTDRKTRAFITQSFEDLYTDSDDFQHLLAGVPLIELVCSRKPLRSGTEDQVSLKTKSRLLSEINRTVVTYRVRQYAQGLFVQPMQVVGSPSDTTQHSSPPPATFIHPDNHTDIHWDLESGMGPSHYQSVLIDGVQYNVGDSVIIIPGQDVNGSRDKNAKQTQSRSTNHLANSKWFAKICYFFEDQGKKCFHAQWYQHGSQILLQETAHSQHLFLINECDDLDLNCIYQKCNLKILEPTDQEPLPDLDFEDNDFFTGLTWDQDDASFVEVTSEEYNAVLKACEPWQPCFVCGLVKLEEVAARWTPLPDGGLSHLHVVYHPHDFVYLRPSASADNLYQIAQIVEFYEDDGEWFAHLRLFARHSLLARRSLGDEIVDDRRLYMTSTVLYCRPLTVIDGKNFVVHSETLTLAELENWVEYDDHFYIDSLCNNPDPKSLEELSLLPLKVFKSCAECMEHHAEAIEESSSLLKKHGPLRGLELFAGAGGLSTGFNVTGFVQTKWAVEFNPEIAHTYHANHPNTIVYNQDSNALLKHAIHTFEGKNPSSLKTRRLDKPEVLPSLPMPGEVDFIYGGPPCQSFSGMNHSKRDDDQRSTMPCNMLSYVEFYHPQYFLLENVKGMVHFKLAQQRGKNDGSAVKFGVIKFILRSLVGLGYQARFKVLQAGQYGAPQGRNRVIFWGARRDVPLPDFPVPTHLFEPVDQFNMPTGDKLRPPTRITWLPGEPEPECHQCAPMPAVTALDAISDLTPFDWINPHDVIPQTRSDVRTLLARKAQGILQCDAVKDGKSYAGFNKPVAYAKKSLNRYQLFMRKQMGDHEKVKYHYSQRFNELVVERVVNIPLKPRANHKCLPEELAYTDKNDPGYNTLFMRIDKDGHFNTALTTVNPSQKGGSVLHPTQKRIVTVRECARSQGFPDHYQFLSLKNSLSGTISDQLRQIGNAVPIPLGMALGKELGKVLVQLWKMKDEHALEERNASPEVEMYDSESY